MGTVHSIVGSCVVCDESDARALSTTRLSRGEVVVVCGTHALVHERNLGRAASVDELRALVGERRDRDERRATGDELAEALTAAFTPSDRRRIERRQ